MRRLAPSLLFMAFALTSCTTRLALVVEPDARIAWEALIAAHPLPKGIAASEGTGVDKASNRLTMTIRRTTTSASSAPGAASSAPGAASSAPGAASQARTIIRIPLAPVVPLWDPRQDIRADSVAGGIELVRLASIEPPLRALSVDGKYPGDADYPFFEETVLEFRGRDKWLSAWFLALPEAADPACPVWVAAVGDIMPARGVDATLMARGPEAVFGDTLGILRGSDLVLGNLEAPASYRGVPASKGYTFRFRPQALDALKSAGFSYFSLTNNHCLDYGPEAFLDTLDNLAVRGIATSGAGKDLAAAKRPSVLERKGQTFHVYSLGLYPAEGNGWDGRKYAAATETRPGILWADEETKDFLKEHMHAESGFRIVMVHGGEEWSRRPTEWFHDLCRELVDMGADVVIGSHPHVLQGMEGYRGSLIAYSLGNFVFPGMDEMDGGEDSMILRFGVWNGKICYIQPVPARLSGVTVRLNTQPGSGAAILRMSRELSSP